jgi:hypothetical protein
MVTAFAQKKTGKRTQYPGSKIQEDALRIFVPDASTLSLLTGSFPVADSNRRRKNRCQGSEESNRSGHHSSKIISSAWEQSATTAGLLAWARAASGKSVNPTDVGIPIAEASSVLACGQQTRIRKTERSEEHAATIARSPPQECFRRQEEENRCKWSAAFAEKD